MEDIVKYLSNPLQAGVYYGKFTINFSKLEQFIRDMAKTAKKQESKELIKTADSIKEEGYLTLEEIKENFVKAILYFVSLEECPKEIQEYLSIRPRWLKGFRGVEPDRRLMLLKLRRYRHRRKPLYVFDAHTLDDINDVIVIETEEGDEANVLLFEVTTTKEKGMSRFEKFVKSIPHIGKTVKEIRKRKTYSSRYAFRPYPLAIQIWLEHEKAIIVSKDLRDFLKGSIHYHSDEEWRTSIVLSAIAVESVLADLYEEKYKKYAPNVPLGELYQQVKDKIHFPSHIKTAIEMVNEARISAVHRSRLPVSDREATNALYGSTTFIMWFSSNF